MKVELLSYTQGGEELIEYAGRVCHRSKMSGDSGKFIRWLIGVGHLSVIEHAVATFEFSGISRVCSHQIVRHRLASYSQESQRYCDTSEFIPVIPDSIKESEAGHCFYDGVMIIKALYKQLRVLGVSKEDARFILPNATSTRMVMTANLREWRHFIKVRADSAAQWEIQAVAKEVLKELYQHFPNVFRDLYVRFLVDDTGA